MIVKGLGALRNFEPLSLVTFGDVDPYTLYEIVPGTSFHVSITSPLTTSLDGGIFPPQPDNNTVAHRDDKQ